MSRSDFLFIQDVIQEHNATLVVIGHEAYWDVSLNGESGNLVGVMESVGDYSFYEVLELLEQRAEAWLREQENT